MKLTVVSGKNIGKIFAIEEGSNLIGRWDPEQTAFPEIDLEQEDEDAKVSRKHALIERDGNSVSLEDLGSLNGTFLNRDTKLAPHQKYGLRSGDEIMIGKLLLRFEEV